MILTGHAKIRSELEPLGIRVATGEACQNRVIFKQLMQAKSIDVCQIDTCRVGGVNENLAIILMAAKFNSTFDLRKCIPFSNKIFVNFLKII